MTLQTTLKTASFNVLTNVSTIQSYRTNHKPRPSLKVALLYPIN